MTTRTDERTCRHLHEKIRGPLPGRIAQRSMLPPGRSLPDRTPDHARDGAVLLALLPTAAGYAIPLIERSDDGGPHSRQIAFPGGARETDDDFPVGTALREAQEEIALPAEGLTVIGRLSPLYISVSNFLIAPVLACGHDVSPAIWDRLIPDPREARRVLMVDPFRLEASRAQRRVYARGHEYVVPSYRWEDDIIWGATAIILAELCALLN